jgi:broad specificity phosphatase PhoE
MALFLLRHCKTLNSINNLFTGQSDIDICSKDIDISNFLSQNKDMKIYCSTLNRCKQTLELFVAQKDISQSEVVFSSQIIERNYGDFEGKEKDKIKKEYHDYFLGNTFNYKMTPPNGEGFDVFVNRIRSFVYENIFSESKNNINVIIIAHTNVFKALLCVKYCDNKFAIWNNLIFENGKIYNFGEE